MGTLYVVGTPIGNLKDITLRALEILKSVDFVFAEDTRVTRGLLSHYEIKTPVSRYNEHQPEAACRYIGELLATGKNIALVSDAGTPGISDPGALLIGDVRKNLPEVKIIAIPGASAIVSALSVAGIFSKNFVFLGYPPMKNKRKKFFTTLAELKIRPAVLYESPHRLQKTFDNLREVLGESAEIVVVKEITKIFEDCFRGPIKDAKTYFTGEKARGEFVLIIP